MCELKVKCALCEKEYDSIYEECDIDNGKLPSQQGCDCSSFIGTFLGNDVIYGCYGSSHHDFSYFLIKDKSILYKISDRKQSICDSCIDEMKNKGQIIFLFESNGYVSEQEFDEIRNIFNIPNGYVNIEDFLKTTFDGYDVIRFMIGFMFKQNCYDVKIPQKFFTDRYNEKPSMTIISKSHII